MSEPTIEEMRDAVIAAYPESVVFHAGDDTFCILTDGEVSFPDRISGWAENEDVAWHYAYRRLPAKAAPEPAYGCHCKGCNPYLKAAPESEDEAFERFLIQELDPTAVLTPREVYWVRRGWNARARLDRCG